jgi:hypothetical protein
MYEKKGVKFYTYILYFYLFIFSKYINIIMPKSNKKKHNSGINPEDVTLHKLLFYSFQSVFFKNGFVDNGISKDILTNAFKGHSELCMMVGGIFVFDKDTVYYYPFNAFPSIMEGGSNELEKYYDPDNITDDLKNRSFMDSMKKLLKPIEGKMYEHHKAVHIIKLIVYTVFLIVVGVISLRLLFFWTGAVTYTEQSIVLGREKFKVIETVVDSKTPYTDSIHRLVKEINGYLKEVEDITNDDRTNGFMESNTSNIAVYNPSNYLLEPPKTYKEIALYKKPKSSNELITIPDIKKDNMFNYFYILTDLNNAIDEISNNPLLDTVTGYSSAISENIVTLKELETSLLVYKKKMMKDIDNLRDNPGEGIIYGAMSVLNSMYDFTIRSISMQPTESPVEKLILVVTTIDEILGLINPAMSEMTYKSTTIGQSLSLAKSVFSLSLFFKGMMTIAFCITSWLLYKYNQKIKELNIEKKVISHQKMLESSGSVLIELFKLMMNKKEITPRIMEQIMGNVMNELIEGEGILTKNIDTYAKMKVSINISDEDMRFLDGLTSMIKTMGLFNSKFDLHRDGGINDAHLPIGINDALLNFMIAQFKLYKERNPRSADSSPLLLTYGGTKRKTKKSRKTKKTRKTRKTKKPRKTKKSRKTRKGSKRSNRKH